MEHKAWYDQGDIDEFFNHTRGEHLKDYYWKEPV